jgi:UDP-N-acetylglucosamine 2-epimerase (non-hydrolysing)
MKRRWLVPFGTRPEIVKLAPVVTAMRDANIDVHTLATGQQADPRMADEFFAELRLEPDFRWDLPADEPARVGAMLERAYATLGTGDYGAILLVGDTHTVPLFALAARRFSLPVVHVEAGLRSYNPRSVEEGNRRVAGTLAAVHCAPTDLAAQFLAAEGVPSSRVFVVGNPVTDSLLKYGPPRRRVAERAGAVVTMHRATNVDNDARLRELADLVRELGRELGIVRFPVHPRTRDRLAQAGITDLERAPGVSLEEPLGYRDMLAAIASASVVITDSGGLQEEAAWYGVPVVVLRNTTPRWEGVLAGTAAVVGVNRARAVAAAQQFCEPGEQERVAAVPCPYGDGHVGPRVASLVADPAVAPLLAVEEPVTGLDVLAAVRPEPAS